MGNETGILQFGRMLLEGAVPKNRLLILRKNARWSICYVSRCCGACGKLHFPSQPRALNTKGQSYTVRPCLPCPLLRKDQIAAPIPEAEQLWRGLSRETEDCCKFLEFSTGGSQC